ncbi:MAG TPA: hypothetical protein VK726_27025 [Acetobacteraceae bacterium]|jgi:dipeptidase E|nr:hypothetical protein [Acetobacteraceae bacterium]
MDVGFRSVAPLHRGSAIPTLIQWGRSNAEREHQALDLLPFEFFPHLGKNVRYLTQLIACSRDSGRPILACPDGDGVVVADELVRPIGAVLMVQNGKVAPALPTGLDDLRRPEVS